MRILITNDDGYLAKGIHTLSRMLSKYGEVTVVAPKRPQSGMSAAVSLGAKELAYKHLGQMDGADWSYLDATPASCVKFALNFLYQGGKPDMVVSGINHGSNATAGACYSGTLGAAEEAAINGIPAIGVSLHDQHSDADFSAVESLFPSIFEKLCAHAAKGSGLYYNVNFPKLPLSQIKGTRAAVMGKGRWIKEFLPWDEALYNKFGMEKGPAEEGEKMFMMIGQYEDAPDNPPTADHHLMENGYVAVAASKVDRTDPEETERLKGFIEEDN